MKNRELFDKKEITETFNSYFVNVSPNLVKCICESQNKKRSGYDDISADVVKRVSDEIFAILKHIFNISLAKGVFPDKLKLARVTPIFKKGNNTLITNYRQFQSYPVSQIYLNL